MCVYVCVRETERETDLLTSSTPTCRQAQPRTRRPEQVRRCSSSERLAGKVSRRQMSRMASGAPWRERHTHINTHTDTHTGTHTHVHTHAGTHTRTHARAHRHAQREKGREETLGVWVCG